MVRLTIRLAIVALLAHAGIKIVPVFWTYLKFKDAMVETARFPGRRSEAELTAKANKIAAELDVPLNDGAISVKRLGSSTTIDTRYVAQLEYFPKQYYPWEFAIHIDEAPRFADWVQ